MSTLLIEMPVRRRSELLVHHKYITISLNKADIFKINMCLFTRIYADREAGKCPTLRLLPRNY